MTKISSKFVFYIFDNQILAPIDNQFKTDIQLEQLLGDPITPAFHIKLENQALEQPNPELATVFAYQKKEAYPQASNYIEEYYQLANLYHLIDDDELLINAGKATQIAHHFSTHQYCGRCANRMQHNSTELNATCDNCNDVFYPRISPCMIVLVYRGDQILLAKRPEPTARWYSLLAGFAEAGETLEQCVEREIYEEVKLKVGNIQYYKSQAWPFPNQLMVGYTAEYVSGNIDVDGIEIADAQWFSIDDLPEYPPNISISGQLIEHFIATQR